MNSSGSHQSLTSDGRPAGQVSTSREGGPRLLSAPAFMSSANYSSNRQATAATPSSASAISLLPSQQHLPQSSSPSIPSSSPATPAALRYATSANQHAATPPPQQPNPSPMPSSSSAAARLVSSTPQPAGSNATPPTSSSKRKKPSSSSAAAGGAGAGVGAAGAGGGSSLLAAEATTPVIVSAEAMPAAKRKPTKKKTNDSKRIVERVAAVVPESSMMMSMLTLEQQVDAQLMRRKREMMEAIKEPERQPRILRLEICNLHRGQAKGEYEKGSEQGRAAAAAAAAAGAAAAAAAGAAAAAAAGADFEGTPSWTLQLWAHVLRDAAAVDGGGVGGREKWPEGKSAAERCLLRDYFKRIEVRLDPSLYPEQPTIEWHAKLGNDERRNTIEVTRPGSTECKLQVALDMKYSPDRFQLSPALSSLLGIEVETRARIISSLWQYVKWKRLQDPSDPSVIVCNEPLKTIFNEERIKFSSIPAKLHPHLSPPACIVLPFQLSLSGPSPSSPTLFDISIDDPTLSAKAMADLVAGTDRTRELDALEDGIARDKERLDEHLQRRAFFLAFSQSPVDFIRVLMVSQEKDLNTITGHSKRQHAAESRWQFYEQPWVEDAVLRYLHRRLASGMETAP